MSNLYLLKMRSLGYQRSQFRLLRIHTLQKRSISTPRHHILFLTTHAYFLRFYGNQQNRKWTNRRNRHVLFIFTTYSLVSFLTPVPVPTPCASSSRVSSFFSSEWFREKFRVGRGALARSANLRTNRKTTCYQCLPRRLFTAHNMHFLEGLFCRKRFREMTTS